MEDITATPPAATPKAAAAKKPLAAKKADELDLDSLLTATSKGTSGEDDSFSSITMIDLD